MPNTKCCGDSCPKELMKLVTPTPHTARLSLPAPGIFIRVEQVNNVTTSQPPHFTLGRNDSLGHKEVED